MHWLFALPFNLALLGAEILLLRLLARRHRAADLVIAAPAWGLGVLVASALLGRHLFGSVLLLSWALFAHGPLLLVAVAVLHWRDSRRVAGAAIAGAALLIAVGADAFLVEPSRLEVTTLRIRSPRVKAPLRLVLVADVQTDHVGTREREVVRRVLAEKPDLVLIAGDHLQEGDDRKMSRLRSAYRAVLLEEGFRAARGVVAVEGNTDSPGWRGIFAGLPVECTSATATLAFGDVSVTALSLQDSFDPALVVSRAPGFHVVLGHGPDYARGRIDADLLLAGHTHGGQVQLPWIGPLVTLSTVPRSWASGVTALEGGRTLVVSRGIGMERGLAPRLRFLCPPELVVIDVEPGP